MTAIKRFVISAFVLAATVAVGMRAAPPSDGAFSRPATWDAGPYLSDALPSPVAALAVPNAGLLGAEDDGSADAARMADARAPFGPRAGRDLPGSDRRDSVKPYLIPFETGPPAA